LDYRIFWSLFFSKNTKQLERNLRTLKEET